MEERGIQLKDLKSISLFKALPKQTLSKLVRLGTIRVYQPGATIYRAHNINTKIILILRGSISINYAYANQEVPVEIVNQNNLWGYTTLLNPGKKYPYHVVNNDSVLELIELPVTKLLQLLGKTASVHTPLLYELARLQSQRSRQRQQKLALLFAIADMIHSVARERTQLNQILKVISQYLNASCGLIAWFDDISKSIIIEASLNYSKQITGKKYKLASDTILSQVYNTNQSLHINRETFEAKYKTAAYHRQTMLIAPLRTKDVTYGAILCACKKESDFTTDDELTLNAAAPMITATLIAMHQEQFESENKRLKNDYV